MAPTARCAQPQALRQPLTAPPSQEPKPQPPACRVCLKPPAVPMLKGAAQRASASVEMSNDEAERVWEHKVQAHSAHPPRRRHADVGASFSALVQLSSIKPGQSWGWGRRPTASCAAPINEHTARWRHGSWLPQHASVPLPLAPLPPEPSHPYCTWLPLHEVVAPFR
jgi:hypothetical protein